MVELLVLASLAFAALVVFVVLASVFGILLSIATLPFRILGWLFKGLAMLVALPFVAVFGLLALVVLGAGALMFFVPFLPLALLALAAWWLVRRTRRSAASVTG